MKSDVIKDFLDLLDDCKNKETYIRDEIKRQERITQDILHKIELEGYEGRNKLATQLKYNRKDRRYYKDIWEEIEIINKWRTDNPQAANQLKQVLGCMRKVESYHKDRTYYPRELKGEQK